MHARSRGREGCILPDPGSPFKITEDQGTGQCFPRDFLPRTAAKMLGTAIVKERTQGRGFHCPLRHKDSTIARYVDRSSVRANEHVGATLERSTYHKDRAHRAPSVTLRLAGPVKLRKEESRVDASSAQLPPRITRKEAATPLDRMAQSSHCETE